MGVKISIWILCFQFFWVETQKMIVVLNKYLIVTCIMISYENFKNSLLK